MAKKQLGPTTQLFPMPALMVAVKTGEDTANILTVAWAAMIGGSPAMMALEIGKSHYSTPFIEAERSFTVNVPSAKMAAVADYCGMVSGKKDPNKPQTCGLTMAPSAHISSPIIEECPLSFECKLVQQVETQAGVFYVVEILETHVDESALDADGKVSSELLDPLLFTPDGYYHRVGENLGKAWSIGKALQ